MEDFPTRYLKAIQTVRDSSGNMNLAVPGAPPDVARKRAIASLVYPADSADLSLSHLEYRLETGRDLDLQNPRDIAAKLRWLMLHDRRQEYGSVVDKYAVRDIVAAKLDKSILAASFGIAHNLDDIRLLHLPAQFVIKATHGWNMNYVCRDSSQLDWTALEEKTRLWLSTRHELRHGEWPYSLVAARLHVEELLDNGTADLLDYKFFCFNGKPAFFKIDADRQHVHHQAYFSLDWDPLPFRNPNVARLAARPSRPQSFDDMIDIAETLSAGIPFARIDLYDIRGRVIFGEITLYPCGGNLRFEPWEWSEAIGDLLHLPRS